MQDRLLVGMQLLFIEDTIWRETAAPSVFGLGVFVIRFDVLQLAVYAWHSVS